MFPNDPTLYGATLPQRDFSHVNPYFAQWNQQFPWPTYGQQFPMQYGQQFPMQYGQQLPLQYGQQFPLQYGQQVPPQYGQQFPLQYGQQFPLPHGQQIPWSFYPRINQPFMQNEFVPPVLPFQAPIAGKGQFGQVPYLPFPQSNFNFPQFKTQLPYAF